MTYVKSPIAPCELRCRSVRSTGEGCCHLTDREWMTGRDVVCGQSHTMVGDLLDGEQIGALKRQQFQRSTMLGYGFSYFHRRAVALKHPFGDTSFGGDFPVADAFVNAGGAIRLVNDRRGLVLHRLHGKNVSVVFPQYRLPSFMLDGLFPGYARYEQLIG